MTSDTYSQTPYSSIFELENQSIELEQILSKKISNGYKLSALLSFFSKIISAKNQKPFQSYYLQFENWIPAITDGIMQVNWDPHYLLQLNSIIDNFILLSSDSNMKHSLNEVKRRIANAAGLMYLYIGEVEKAASLLNVELGNDQIFKTSQSELEKATALITIVSKSSIKNLYDVESFISKWKCINESYSPNNIHVIFVENFLNTQLHYYHPGVIMLLNGVVRERPHDAEDDRVVINNQVSSNGDSCYWSLLDGIAATRLLIGDTSPIMRRRYTYQFSINNKDAEFYGNSIGAASGFLAYSMVLNRYYRAPVTGIGRSVAVTGGLRQDGKLIPVDRQGLKAKLNAVFFSPLSRVVVPSENLSDAVRHISDLKKKYPNRYLSIEGIDTLKQGVQDRNIIHEVKISIIRKGIGKIKRIPWQFYVPIFSGVFILIAFLLFIFGVLKMENNGQPVDYQIKGDQLCIYDAEQNFLWSHRFPVELSESFYQNTKYRTILFDDIDNDGQVDVLYGSYDDNDAKFSGNVWRFDSRGEIVWQRHVGRTVRFGGEVYENHFRIAQIHTFDLDNDGKKEIIVVANQYPYYPVCIQIYHENGTLLNEYWHVGQLDVISFIDLDNDGRSEILFGAQNNEYRCAVLAVLQFPDFRGCSPQTPGSNYYPDSLTAGTEKYYMRFPLSKFTNLGMRSTDNILSLRKGNNGITVVVTNFYPYYYFSEPAINGMIYYKLDRQLKIRFF